MNIQLKNIILWPKKEGLSKKVLNFEEGKLNIIHGISKTGKSAIIPIIDYCLCSSKNKTPVGIIRDTVDWFGIKLDIDGKELLLMRENTLKRSKMQYLEGERLVIPEKPSSNITIDLIKEKMNDLLGVSFLKINPEDKVKGSRASFRDLVSFNFQPQSIVANANCLLYKSDIADYRERLKEIFDFAIGAENSNDLLNKIKYSTLVQKRDRLKKERDSRNAFFHNELIKNQDLILKAVEYGLIQKNQIVIDDTVSIMNNLEILIQKNFSDLSISIEGLNVTSDKIIDINKRLEPLEIKLRQYKQEQIALKNAIQLANNYGDILQKQRKNLSIAEFIGKFCRDYPEDTSVLGNIDNLTKKIQEIENDMRKNIPTKKTAYQERLLKVEEDISKITAEIDGLIKEYTTLKNYDKEKTAIESFFIEIGRAKNLLSYYIEEIKKYDDEICLIENEINSLKKNKNKLPMLLNKLTSFAQEKLPSFAEFRNISGFDKNDLTVKIKKDNDDNEYFLSETGSGSNWLAYHLAFLMAFHKLFIENSDECSAFNFLILDQPTQVYFPPSNLTPLSIERSEDISAVKEIFSILNEFTNELSNKIQVIVLDHAGPDIWGTLNNIHIVANWADNDKLIPSTWI